MWVLRVKNSNRRKEEFPREFTSCSFFHLQLYPLNNSACHSSENEDWPFTWSKETSFFSPTIYSLCLFLYSYGTRMISGVITKPNSGDLSSIGNLQQVPPCSTLFNENAHQKQQGQVKVPIKGSMEQEIIALLKEMRDGKDEKITEGSGKARRQCLVHFFLTSHFEGYALLPLAVLLWVFSTGPAFLKHNTQAWTWISGTTFPFLKVS